MEPVGGGEAGVAARGRDRGRGLGRHLLQRVPRPRGVDFRRGLPEARGVLERPGRALEARLRVLGQRPRGAPLAGPRPRRAGQRLVNARAGDERREQGLGDGEHGLPGVVVGHDRGRVARAERRRPADGEAAGRDARVRRGARLQRRAHRGDGGGRGARRRRDGLGVGRGRAGAPVLARRRAQPRERGVGGLALALQRRRAARRQGDGVVAAVGALGQSRWWYAGQEPDELLAEIFLWACHGPPPCGSCRASCREAAQL